jgi:hypothetical protein
MDCRRFSLWLARFALAIVFFFNVTCALAFIARPEVYMHGFEVSDVPGKVTMQGIGILFLMWNVTYPLAIWHPWNYRWLFVIVIVQQVIGLIGETWMLLTLPSGHTSLATTGARFVAFDGGGLAAMVITLALMTYHHRRTEAA